MKRFLALAFRQPGVLWHRAGHRLRPRLWLILQTAAAAVTAWYLAILLLPSEQPFFAPIATVIALGASLGQRGARAAELIAGVVLGLAVADVIGALIGTGPLQIGALIVLAMAVAVVLGGRELLVNEAAISAILLASLAPSGGPGFAPDRVFEALIGGGVALAVNSVLFPPDPKLIVGRAAQALFGQLGRTLEEIATALAEGDPERAEQALRSARATDVRIHDLDDAVTTGLETTRLAPPRRAARRELERYARALDQLDFAVRNTRVLARHALRHVRAGRTGAWDLPIVIEDLAQAVWALAAQYDDPARAGEVQRRALGAAGAATEIAERERELALTEIAVQVRSTAVDLLRASELVDAADTPGYEPPTEELLAA